MELETQREHQEDDAELGQRLDDAGIGDDGNRDVRPDDESGDDLAQHDRLAQALEDDRRDRRDGKDDRQRAQEFVHVVHVARIA